MASTNLEREIQAKVEAFVTELTELVKQAALESVERALGGGPSAPAAAKRGPRKKTRPGRASGRRSKRSPASLEAVTERLLTEIKGKPGRRIEEIARTMRTTTKDLALPARKLLKAKKVKTTGQKRSTKYFPR